MNVEQLKEVLSLQSQTREETEVVNYLIYRARSMGREVKRDTAGNVYLMPLTDDPYVPCVAAHTDTVHTIQDGVQVVYDVVANVVYAEKDGQQVGCGGDDKAGVYIALQLLEDNPALMGAFFHGEEAFCLGSSRAEGEWFNRIGWMMEFDSPQGNIATFICNGEQLFDPQSHFGRTAINTLGEYNIDDWQMHPFTDVFFMRQHFQFSCLNLPAGYYHMHTRKEYVVVSDVDNTLKAAQTLIDTLGTNHYPFVCRGINASTISESFGKKLRPLTLSR